MNNRNVICVLAGCPRPGKIKSPLEELLGQKNASFLTRAFLMDMIATSLRVKNSSLTIAHWPPESGRDFEEVIYLYSQEEKNRRVQRKLNEIDLIPQRGDSPGERMTNISEHLFGAGAGKILMVGAYVPQLHPSIFRAALELLNRKQVVLGPTFEGGYYLIGLKRPVPEIFNGIHWGGSSVYREMAEVLDCEKINWQELELSYDVESPENLEQLYIEIDTLRLTGEESICYHTERCLKNLTD